MRLTKHGLREWLGGAVIALVLSLAWGWLAVNVNPKAGYVLLGITWLLWLAVAAFFRVPNRQIIADPAALVSPADGVVRDIEAVEDHGIEIFAGQKLMRVGIFLSVLDVHVNRVPIDGTVTRIAYRHGTFLNASVDKASTDNERNALAIRLADGREIAVVQIAGLIARRILCDVREGDAVRTGARFGIIRFGSRTDLYLPEGALPLVSVGQLMIGGETVIAELERMG